MKKKIIEFTIYLFLAFLMSTLYAEWHGSFEGFLAHLGIFVGQNMYPIIAAIIISVIFYVFKRKDVFRIFMNTLWGLTMLSWYIIFGNTALYIIGILLLVYVIYLFITNKTKKTQKSESNNAPTRTFYDMLKVSSNATSEENQTAYRDQCIETHLDKEGHKEVYLMKKNLNSILTIFLYLVILRHIIAIFTSISQLIMAFSGYLSLPVLLWNLAMHIAMIVVLFNILNIKKWAVYAFGGIQVINVAVLTLFFKSDFFTCSFVAVLLCLLLVVLFCLKKDNVSAWRLFFPKKEEKENDELACVDEIESFIEEKDVEETFIPELSVNKENEEKEIRKPKTPAIQNDDLFKSLESLPLKEDGSIDYEQMSAIQQFAYTYKTESLEVALKDLNGDIKVMEKSIAKVKKELSSLSGGARAKLRDSLREEQAKLDDLYGLRDKYLVKNNKHKIWIYALAFISIIICIAFFIGISNDYNKNKSVKQQEIEAIKVKETINNEIKTTHKYVDTKEILFSQLTTVEGYRNNFILNDFFKEIEKEQTRRKLFEFLLKEGYDNFATQLELETYLGYKTVNYRCNTEDKMYNVAISYLDTFEKEHPMAFIKFLNEGKEQEIPLRDCHNLSTMYKDARLYITIRIAKDYKNSKRRLLYYSLLATGYLSQNELGSMTEFLNSLSNVEKIRDFYFKLLNWGFFSSELGSETEFCDNLSTDFSM